MRTPRCPFLFAWIIALAAGVAFPAAAQLGFSFGPSDSGGGLSIGGGQGPGVYRPGQKNLHGVAPGGLGKATTVPKPALLAPHGTTTTQKLAPHPTVGNGVPTHGADTQIKKIETGASKDHPTVTGAPKDAVKQKSDAIAPTPSPSPAAIEKIESKKVVTPSPTPSGTPPIADKSKSDAIEHADKPTDGQLQDEPPVVVIPAPVPAVATPPGPPPPGGAGPPPQPKVPDAQKAVYTPPTFPEIDKLEDCDDCDELWESILHYEEIIEEDTEKLAEREKELQDHVAELDKIKADLVKATTAADRTYDEQMIAIDENAIKARTKQNADLQKRIDEESDILDDRIAKYEQCYDRYCAKPPPVAETAPNPPAPPPQVPPVAPPPTTPPVIPPVAVTPDKACHGPAGQPPVDFDFNLDGPRPPAPSGEVFVMPPHTGAKMMSFQLLWFYEGGAGRSNRGMNTTHSYYADDFGGEVVTSTPKSPYDADSVILDDETLEAVRGETRADNVQSAVNFQISRDAGKMLGKLGCDQRGIFRDRGRSYGWGDSMATMLGLGTFSLFWEASCKVGPKRCCIPDSSCPSGYATDVPYTCTLNWTFYKVYNFGYQTGTGGDTWWGKVNRVFKAINPVGWFGDRFNVFGYWSYNTGGSESACMSAAEAPSAPPPPKTQSR